MSVGKAGEVLISATVREAIAGKHIAFADHGIHELKGSEGDLLLFSDPSPTEACDDFRSVATFQPWERIV